MSTLIDNLIGFATTHQNINGQWYIAKPYHLKSLKLRFKDAFRVLIGKSQAYHFKEDELESR